MNDARTRTLERIGTLPSLGLRELEASAALQRRRDRKYLVDWATFEQLVAAVSADHRALEIAGRRAFAYDTSYFDSADLLTFRAHVQDRRRRFKVRVRHYTDSDLCSLEIKLRGARGETVKRRVSYDPANRSRLTGTGSEFLSECLLGAYGEAPPEDLRPVVRTRYRRVTLVHRDGGQRLTCDFDLAYEGGAADGSVPALSPDHVIVETKSLDGRGVADVVLRDLGARPVRCSKYLLGVGLTGLRPVPVDLRRLSRRYFSVGSPVRAQAVAGV